MPPQFQIPRNNPDAQNLTFLWIRRNPIPYKMSMMTIERPRARRTKIRLTSIHNPIQERRTSRKLAP